jgi:GT2 family glycosyltransferase
VNQERRGFAQNYNSGMGQTKGKYVMILNDDTLIPAGALDALLSTLRKNPQYGMVGPKLISPDGSVQPPCARPLPTPFSFLLIEFFLDPGTPQGKIYNKYRQKQIEKLKSGPIPCIAGACMLSSKGILDQVGYLDEVYNFYYEDVEWCHRIQKHGYQVGYVAESEIVHLGDQTMVKLREWGQKSKFFGALRYFFHYHNASKFNLWILWILTLVNYFSRSIVFKAKDLMSNKGDFGEIYLRLLKWVLRMHPKNDLVQNTLKESPRWTI